VRRAGGRVRIAAKLSDALAGEQIWAERFDDRMDDIFDLQDKVATAVAGAIDSTITDAEMRRALTRPTTSPTAYELTLRANALLCRHGREAHAEALRLSEEAVALDPNFAWAIAIRGFCLSFQVLERWSLDPKADRKAAIALADEAVRKGTNDQMALTVTAGLLLNLRHDRETATHLIARALELNPGKAFVLFWAGWIDFWNDRLEESLAHFEHSMRLDPRSAYRPFQLSGMGTALLALGRMEEAIVVLSESLRLVRHSSALMPLIVALALSGRAEEARAQLASIGLRIPFGQLAPRMIGTTLPRMVTEAGAILDDHSQAAA
jgi:adenylate cyclase